MPVSEGFVVFWAETIKETGPVPVWAYIVLPVVAILSLIGLGLVGLPFTPSSRKRHSYGVKY